MKTRISFKWIFLFLFVAGTVAAATISRVKTFSDGEILTAADLNAEFDNVVDGVNSITNDNIATNAAIRPTKISAAIKGDAINRNTTSGALSVKVDDSTIEVSGDNLRVKDGGITGAKLNANVVDDASLQYTSSQLSIKDAGVTTAKINDAAVTQAKRAALGQQLSASSGQFFANDSSVTFANVTNLSITITTTGRPVFLSLISDGTIGGVTGPCYVGGGTTSDWIMAFSRAGTPVSFWVIRSGLGSNNNKIPCSSFLYIDVPSAGTYTYTVQHRSFGTSVSRFINDAKLIAYEL